MDKDLAERLRNLAPEKPEHVFINEKCWGLKMRVDLLLCDPATLEWRRFPCWEWDGQKVKELNKWAENFR